MSENLDTSTSNDVDKGETKQEPQKHHTPSNLSSSEIDTETKNKLRGDAIGDTLYSESFVVTTLMQLSEPIQWCEKLEQDLCFLWDSTLERDVCDFLIQMSYPQIACNVINATEEARLIEILLGILANICCICNDCQVVSDEQIASVLLIISSDDPLVLIQVARFVKAVSYNAVKVSYISESILEHFNFILMNSVNSELIINSLDAISKVTVYNKIDATLLKGEYIKSSCIAYQTLCKCTEKHVDIIAFTHLVQIISNICTYINESDDNSDLYSSVSENCDEFLSELKGFFNYYTKDENLLPLEEELVYIVDVIVSVFQILQLKYCSSLFKSITIITASLIKHNWEDIDIFLELFCYFVSLDINEQMKCDLNRLPTKNVLLVLNRIKNNKVDYEFNYTGKFNSLCEEYLKD